MVWVCLANSLSTQLWRRQVVRSPTELIDSWQIDFLAATTLTCLDQRSDFRTSR